jgi:murein DD-endopeptidase MepM/ murein hydrolase activator NlpD
VGAGALAAAALGAAVLSATPQLGVAIRARALQPGELAVITVTVPPAAGSVTALQARAFDRDLAAFRTGEHTWRVLAGLDLDVQPGAYPLTIQAGGLSATRRLLVVKKMFRTRRLAVDPNFVTPPPSAAERIAAEAQLLDATWRASAGERLWTMPFVRPVAEPANSAFGTRSIFNGQPRNAHGGADFLSPAGAPVRAPNAGHVVIARNLYFSGNTVVIDHGLGVFSTLAHLSAFAVAEGDRVEAGAVIGRVGATGRVTGAHLHWAVRVNAARVDPLSVLAMLGSP